MHIASHGKWSERDQGCPVKTHVWSLAHFSPIKSQARLSQWNPIVSMHSDCDWTGKLLVLQKV